MKSLSVGSIIAALAVIPAASSPSAVSAQTNPKFEFADQKVVADLDKPVSKLSAQAGLVVTTGNSETRIVSGGAKGSRKSGENRILAEVDGTYATARVMDEFQPSARAWLARMRYDRFLTKRNSLYATASASGDELAGKQIVGGGQIGYSRLLLQRKRHELTVELGYDFSYEQPVEGDGVAIHSVRVFAGYEGKLTDVSGLTGSVEVLSNLNELTTGAGPIEDTRVNAAAALTTKVFDDISLRFGVTARYDHAPTLLPMTMLPAETLDTKTEVTIIVNFL